MNTIYQPNSIDQNKLQTVLAEMQELGSPKIRAWWNGDAWVAIEGTHRLAAAAQLDLPVEIVEMDLDDEITDHDFYDLPDITTVNAMIDIVMSDPRDAVMVEVI